MWEKDRFLVTQHYIIDKGFCSHFSQSQIFVKTLLQFLWSFVYGARIEQQSGRSATGKKWGFKPHCVSVCGCHWSEDLKIWNMWIFTYFLTKMM